MQDISGEKNELLFNLKTFILDHVIEGVFFSNDNGCSLYINFAVDHINPIPAPKLLNKTPEDFKLLPREKSIEILQSIKRVLELEEAEETEDIVIYSTPDEPDEPYLRNPYYTDFASDSFVDSELYNDRNISERKSLEQLLLECEGIGHRQEQFFNIAPGYFFILEQLQNGSYAMPFASIGIRDLFGLDPESVTKDIAPFVALSHPDDIEMTFRMTEESARNLTPYHVEYRIIHPGKGLRWIECRSLPQRSPDDRTRWYGFMHDITERKQMELQLKKHEMEYRTLAENSPVLILRYDTGCRCIYANRMVNRMHGISDEETLPGIGKTPMENSSAGEYREYQNMIEEVLRTGADASIEFMIPVIRGGVQYHNVHFTAEWNPDGSIIGVLAIGIDITERKQMENTLAAREQEFRALVENSPDVIVRYDTAGRRIYVNPAFNLLTGKSAAVLLNSTPMESPGTSSITVAEQALRTVEYVVAEKKSQEIEFAWVDMNGVYHCFLNRFVPEFCPSSGDVVSVLSIARDITERKQAEQLQYAREMEIQLELIEREKVEKEIKYQNILLSTQQETSIDGILVVDEKSKVKSYNRRFIEIWNLSPEIIKTGEDKKLLKEVAIKLADPNEFLSKVNYLYEHKELLSRDEIILADGHVLDRFSAPIVDENNKYYGRVWYFRDITDAKKREMEIRSLVENSPDAISRYNRKAQFMYANTALLDILGKSMENILNKTIMECGLRSASLNDYQKKVKKVMNTGVNNEFIINLQNIDGKNLWYEIRLIPECNLEGQVDSVLSVGRDITLLKEAEEKMSHLSKHDVMTGLPNRRFFYDQLLQFMEKSDLKKWRTVLILINLDSFRDINDSFGYAAGDDILKVLAKRIRHSVRQEDFVARLSGDEFVIVMHSDNKNYDLNDKAKKIIEIFSQKVEVNGHNFLISASIGITIYPIDGKDVSTLLSNANTALSLAKQKGRNRFYFFTEEIRINNSDRIELAAELQRALTNNEFELYYQPKVSLKSGTFSGMEALIRWHQPQRGFISPAHFIPVAEEYGLISKIGIWVLETTCREIRQWKAAGLDPVKVAVNLSAGECHDGQILEVLTESLNENSLDGKCIELEITESMVMEDAEKAIDAFKKMKELGVSIAIDDFGTGHSSFSYLKRFPIDYLKIDKSFIDDIGIDSNDTEIVSSIIAMAHSLNLGVVAEGVETSLQLDCLHEIGCDEVQGYYFSKPLTVTDMTELLKQSKK